MFLYQPSNGYCYNSDSLFLYNFVSLFSPKGKVLDVGAGCGVVGLLVARDNEKVKLEAVEKQDIFVEFATINARVNKIKYKLYKTDFLDFLVDEKYDYIISNPPFYVSGSTKSDNDILSNARYNINLPLAKFFKKVSQILKPKSHFIFCYDATQFGLVCSELDKVNIRIVDVQFVHPKVDRVASIVLIHARNGSNAMMKVWQPFFSFNGNEVSQEAKEIYEKAKTQSIKCQL